MTPRVALVYDRVNTPYGGAEQVITALHEIFPQAPLYTSVYHPRAQWAKDLTVKTSFLQKIPFAKRWHRYFVGLMPLAFESFDFSDYDIIISVTSAEAKGVLTKPNQLHLCYLLTPTRYLYSHRAHYEKTHWPFKWPIIGWISRQIFAYLNWWDQIAVHRPDVMIPISELVKDRAEKHYQRSIEQPIYPPLDLSQFQLEEDLVQYRPYYLPDDYYLIISRLVSYKRLELVIQACQQLGQPLVIIGEGPQASALEKIAGPQTYFLGSVSQKQKQAVMSQARALLMPGLEDFGITALEAVATGLPIVLHQKTGAAELIRQIEQETGQNLTVYLQKISLTAVKEAINQVPKRIEPRADELGKVRQSMQQYAITGFKKRFQQAVFTFYQKLKNKGLK